MICKPAITKLWLAIKTALALTLLIATSACFEETVVVKVDKSGKGFVHHHSYNNLESLVGGMMGGLGGLNQNQENKTEYNDEYFAEKAKSMGEGVSVESWKLANNAYGFEGYEAVYAFSDINNLNVATSPGGDQQPPQSAPVDSTALEAQHYFSMDDNRLVIHTPEPETDENQESMVNTANEVASQQMLAMMGNMFQGARVRIQIEALDNIKSTNAHHRDGNRITIMDVRLDELMRDPQLFTEAQRFKALDREEAQKLADRIDGLDVDTQAEIIIQF